MTTSGKEEGGAASGDPQPAQAFEEQVLLSVVHCGDDAYGMTIRRALQDRTGRDISIGAVYTTLRRMEEKGWVASTSRSGEGRARRYFSLTPKGAAALREAVRIRDALWQGLDPGLFPG